MGDQDFVYGGAVDELKVGGSGGTDVGFTRGGVSISRSLSTHLSEVDQLGGHIRGRTIMNEMFIKTTMAQGSLPNLAYAWNIAQTAIVSSSMDVTDSDDQENVIYIKAPGPEGKHTYVEAYRCFAQGNMETGWKKDADIEVAVEFRVFMDTDKTPVRFMDMRHAA
jgi:hypothetical protein